MKLRSAVSIIFLIIFLDQLLKIWIKTGHALGPVTDPNGDAWAQLYFIENPGMAWGKEIPGKWGKMILTLFRFGAVIFGTWYIGRIVKQRYSTGFIVCASLIYAGALGNLIDSMFYGLMFDKGMVFDPSAGTYVRYSGIAQLSFEGYAPFLHGCVVDMLYFPMIRSTWPSWVPMVGGEAFEFFSPIFNIADASISVGVITLLLFQKKFMHKKGEASETESSAETQPTSDDSGQLA